MRVWRLVRRRRLPDAFTGEGARLAGGRWNSSGVRVVYTSDTLALATLEYLVHTSLLHAPREIMSIWADVPDDLASETVALTRLPKHWQRYDPPVEVLREFGDDWIKRGKTAILKVPSAIVPLELNHLLNPEHAAFRRIRVGRPQPVTIDQRLFK